MICHPAKSQQGFLATYLILGALGEGSSWDLRVRPAPAAPAASGNLGTWKSGNLEIWGPGNPEIWRSGDLEIQKIGVQEMKKIKNLKKSNPFCPKCRQGLDL